MKAMTRSVALTIFAMATSMAASPPCPVDQAIGVFEARRFAEARAMLEPCASTDARAALYVGRAHLAERSIDRAIEALEKAAALDPKGAEPQLWLGRAYGQKAMKANVLQQASLAGKVRKAFERAVALDPANIDARLSLIDYYLLAPGIMGGSVAKAREQAAEIRRRDALKGFQAAGRIAEYEKKWDAALSEYERAGREFPQRKEPYIWRANVAAQQKDYARAFDILEALQKAQPSDPTVDYSIGRLGAQTGERLDRAEEGLKRYLQHEPGRDEPALSSAHFQLGVLYDKRGTRELARKEYQRTLELEPSHSGAREALAKK